MQFIDFPANCVVMQFAVIFWDLIFSSRRCDFFALSLTERDHFLFVLCDLKP